MASTPAPSAVASLLGRVSVVRSGAGVVDVLAGALALRAVPIALLLAFATDVLEHVTTRTPGVRVRVPYETAHPEAAVLEHNGARLRLLDDGETVTIMALVNAEKDGAGSRSTAADVQRFAVELLEAFGGAR